MAANSQNMPAVVSNLFSMYALRAGNAWVDAKVESHRNAEATAIALPRNRVGKISDIMSHANGARLVTYEGHRRHHYQHHIRSGKLELKGHTHCRHAHPHA